MQTETAFDNPQETACQSGIRELCSLAAAGLARMYNPEHLLFCNIYARTETGLEQVGCSRRYTMMTLLGLHRHEINGGSSPVPVLPVLECLTENTDWVDSAGDLGLLLWTCAEMLPDHLPRVYRRVRADDALVRYQDGQLGHTMEVAWYLTGLASAQLAGYGYLPGMREQIDAAKEILKRNCGVAGIYGHRSRGKSPAGYLRHRIGSFADQVYPTIALARLTQATGDEEARQMALLTATTMCELQGALGEWSWQYDAATARVVSRYPVYSVHQHAMGPMMLFAVTDAVGRTFTDSLDRSVAWISGENELSRNLIEPTASLVWRCIYLPQMDKYSDAAMRFLRLCNRTTNSKVKIRYECRPYELGWLLYAFAGRSLSN